MKTLVGLFRWLRSLGQTRAKKREIDEELHFHLEMHTAQNIAAGMTPAEADRRARRRFGNVQTIREECRNVHGVSFGETTIQDIRFGLRMLRKNPGFAIVAVLTLALGIGANTAIFSLVNAVMLRPPPFPEHRRLVFLSEKSRHMDDMSISYPNLLDWQQQNQAFEGVAGFRGQGFNLTGRERPQRVEGYGVSASFFSVLRVAPVQGRVFGPDEDQPGAAKVAVLSEGLWQRAFGSDPAILNRPIELNGEGYTVIGIMPRSFQFPRTVELWTPLGLNYAQENWKERGNHPGIYAIARLKQGIALGQANGEMQTIAARLAQQYPESNSGTGVTIMSLRERMVRQARPALLLLLGAVLFVLLIACANLANLLLARSAASLALILLIGACLLVRSFGRMQAVSPGIDTENIVAMYFSLPKYKYGEEHQQRAFFDELLRRTAALPGVKGASVTTTTLGGWQTGYHVQGQPQPPPGQGELCDIATVSPEHFKVMGIRLLRGRVFSDADNEGAQKVVIIDEKLANKFWPNSDPLGHQIQVGGGTNKLFAIVGVVGHVKNYGVDTASREEVYLPLGQHPQPSLNLMIKTARPMRNLPATLRSVVQPLDPDLPLTSLRTMESILGENTAPRRITMLLLSVFSGLAVTLAIIGIYGVMAYSVSQRTREIGLRMALGAQAKDVLNLMMGQGGWLILIGVTVGSVVGLGLTHFMRRLLFEVKPTDPLTYVGMPVLLAIVALLACYIPARRAAKVDPMVALRDE